MILRLSTCILLSAFASVLPGCASKSPLGPEPTAPLLTAATDDSQPPKANATPLERVLASLPNQVRLTQYYDPTYVPLDYPKGDVPIERGVCSDVIVRAFRAGGVDLQKEVHEDMSWAFSAYPQLWGLRRPDRNIDHRRVPNLMRYFQRQGRARPLSRNSGDYLPGDVVAWELPGGRLHVGLVAATRSNDNQHHMVVHNIGAGTTQEDRLFAWKIIGHYRWFDGN